MTSKVLVVDDEPHLEMVIRQVFRKQTRRGELIFLFAENGERALELLADNEDVDVVLSDIKMPRLSGLALLKRLNEERPLIRTVMLTAFGDMKHIRCAMNHGAFDFLTKPINLDDLQITLSKTLQQVDLMKSLHRERQKRHLTEKLERLNESLASTLNLEEILEHFIAILKEMVGYDRALIALDYSGDVLIATTEGWDQPRDEGFDLFLAGLYARVNGVDRHLNLHATTVTGAEQATELLCLGLPMVEGRGGLVLLERSSDAVFSETDCSMGVAVARKAAFAVDNARLYEQVARLAVKDPVTDLHNYRYFMEQATREVYRAHRHELALSLLMFELDWFREAVETQGQAEADSLLQRFAKALGRVCRHTDLVVRYGHDRLAILLVETHALDAAKMVRRLREDIARTLTDQPLALSASPGLAILGEDDTLGEFIAAAERGLHTAER